MNQTDQVIADLIDIAESRGFTISRAEPDLWQILTGDMTIGATDWMHADIRILPKRADNPTFYAEVLAHEVGHVVLNHGTMGKGPNLDPLVAETQADAWAVAYLSARGLCVADIQEHDQSAHDPTQDDYYYRQSAALKDAGYID